jgi:hypothetical protein
MAEISIQRIGRSLASIRIEGTAPLIMNKFSEKARQIMEDAQQGRARVREPKNPEELFQGSLHRLPGEDRYGVPATAFKAGIVDAARYFKGSKLTMTALKQAIFVKGEGPDMLVELDTGVPKMRTDPVRNATGVADIRYRGEFDPWACTLEVVFLPTMFDVSSLVALVDAAGMGGVGEWRPSSKESKSGQYGTYQVPDQDVKVVTL